MYHSTTKHDPLKAVLFFVIPFFLCEQAVSGDGKLLPYNALNAVHLPGRFHIDSLRRPVAVPVKFDCSQESSFGNYGQDHKKKSMLLAMTMSAIIPGTGQFYAQKDRESLIKGAAFLAVELTGFILYLHNHNKGKKTEKKYERFADQNWDVDKYLAFLEASLQSVDDGELGRKDTGVNYVLLEAAENEWGIYTGVSVHHLYKNSRQQYYEMIYKYPEQFALGWSDAVNNPNSYPYTGYTRNNLTPFMIDYRGMRSKSNDYLSTARAMTGVLMINHLLSMADAAWTVKRKNKEEPNKFSMTLRLEHKQYQNELITLPTLRFTF